MSEEIRYRHTAEMGEISGFGGEYEECCQDMLEAGVKWLLENKPKELVMAGDPNIFGLLLMKSEEAEALSKAVIEASGGEATGAMHHSVMSRLYYIDGHGWDAYVKVLLENGDDDDKCN